jgi:S-DNA-T family DNA segregation ATPase FtsK/SpoIIIE
VPGVDVNPFAKNNIDIKYIGMLDKNVYTNDYDEPDFDNDNNEDDLNVVEINKIEDPEIIMPEREEALIKEPIMIGKGAFKELNDNNSIAEETSQEIIIPESENLPNDDDLVIDDELEDIEISDEILSENFNKNIETIEEPIIEVEKNNFDTPIEKPFKKDNPEPELPLEESVSKIFDEIQINTKYIIPTSFLNESVPIDTESWKNEIAKNSKLLVNTLADFGIESRVVNVNRGPVITLYEMQIAPGIKVNKIVGLADDIAMALAAYRVRIVAPIPGKSAIGVEIPNKHREKVTLGDIVRNNFEKQNGLLNVALGKDILGEPVVLDLKKLPHLLIAGATGSGKSVCVNTIITSLIYNYDPNYVRFILVDPKMVELQVYDGLPHLLTPVITEPHLAPMALKWAIQEMERRYKLLSKMSTRDIEKYNQKIEKKNDRDYEKLPYIVIIIDELADLMMVASKEIEGYITRIAQKARAIGIHLVLATQRPSVDIITGIIKANFPARIAFQVAQKTDSRTIIDQNGAEKLLGKGDLLYQSPMSSFPVRIQGAFISEDEILKIVTHLSNMGEPNYIDIETSVFDEEEDSAANESGDELFVEALKIIEETRKASASYLQRRLSIGYNRAARIIEMMEEMGYVGPQQGSKPRDVYI